MKEFVLLVLFLTAFPSLLFAVAEHVICIDSNSGHDNATCLQSCQQPCQTLEYVHRHLKSVANDSVVIEICGPLHLPRGLNFTNFTDLSITGERNITEIFCNTSYSGLSFINVKRLSLGYVRLTNCGTEQNSTQHYKHRMIKELSAVFLFNCRDVNITNCVIYGSNGTGISILNTNGNVLIEQTDIIESSLRYVSSNSDLLFGGSGLHIEFNYCSNGNDAYHFNCIHTNHYKNATYTIYRCRFIRNRASATQAVKSLSEIGPMKCGGGVYIGFAVNASCINIMLESCTLDGNSASEYGGGAKVQFYSTAHDNKVSLLGTTFSNNSVPNDTMGGGLEILFLQFTDYMEHNSILVISCNFTSNFAGHGGGVNIFTGEVLYQDELSAITFTDCIWTNNTALYGAAVHLLPSTWAHANQGLNPLISFISCSITQNMVIDLLEADSTRKLRVQRNGAGAFFSIHVTVVFCGVTTFEGNNGTALYLCGSVAIFNASSQVTFSNNNGTNGGAVSWADHFSYWTGLVIFLLSTIEQGNLVEVYIS